MNKGEKHGCVQVKHGLRSKNGNGRIYNIWRSMKQRCYDPKRKDYHSYGGRGIGICSDWKDSAESFADWALKNGYRDDLTIDRIDNNGDYTPENCRWATRREQDHNKPGVRLYYVDGEEYTLNEVCGKYEIRPASVEKELAKGKSIEESIQQALSRRRVPWSLERERYMHNEARRRNREAKKRAQECAVPLKP